MGFDHILHDLFSFPSRRFAIDSELTRDEAHARIEAIVESRKPLLGAFSRSVRPFAGIVSSDVFKIMRRIGYGNSALPVILGAFESTPNGSRVSITMRLTRFASIFVVLWLSFGAAFLCLAVIAPWMHHRLVVTGAIPVIIVDALGYAWVAIPFGAEARKARNLLAEALQRQPSARVQQVLDNPDARALPKFIKPMLLFMVIGVTTLVLMFLFVPALLIKTQPFRVARQYLLDDSRIRKEFGALSSMQPERWLSVHIRYSGLEGYAAFAIGVTGREGKGTVFFRMRKHLGAWTVTSAEVREPSGREVTLSAAQPEPSPCP